MPRRLVAVGLAIAFAVVLAACGGPRTSEPSAAYPIVPADDLVARGKSAYDFSCASCHADPVEGGRRQFDAPPHDVNGHTWHHADRQLVEWVLEGIPQGTGAMPAFAGRLSEETVVAIIAYLKSTWPAEVQERHALTSQAWEDQLRE